MAIHNTHKIRRQRLREHYLPTGQPFLLYHYSDGIKDYNECVDVNILSQLEAEVTDFDLDEYLPAVTMRLYAQMLLADGFLSEFVYSDIRHKSAYIFLRQKVADYIDSGGEILFFNTPGGADQWIQAHNNHEIEIHRENDDTMIVDETDNEYQHENNDLDEEVSQLEVQVKKHIIDSGCADQEIVRDKHIDKGKEIDNDANLEFRDSVSEENEDDETNDGFFLDL